MRRWLKWAVYSLSDGLKTSVVERKVKWETLPRRDSEERIWLAKYRLNKSPRQGKDFPKTLLKITNEKT